jgi:hypothetical protein
MALLFPADKGIFKSSGREERKEEGQSECGGGIIKIGEEGVEVGNWRIGNSQLALARWHAAVFMHREIGTEMAGPSLTTGLNLT